MYMEKPVAHKKRLSRKALASSVVNSHVGLTTSYTESRPKLQNLVAQEQGKFVRVTNRNQSTFIAVQEDALVEVIEGCLDKAFLSDINPMFINILNNPVDIDACVIDNTRVPEITDARLKALNLPVKEN